MKYYIDVKLELGFLSVRNDNNRDYYFALNMRFVQGYSLPPV